MNLRQLSDPAPVMLQSVLVSVNDLTSISDAACVGGNSGVRTNEAT